MGQFEALYLRIDVLSQRVVILPGVPQKSGRLPVNGGKRYLINMIITVQKIAHPA